MSLLFSSARRVEEAREVLSPFISPSMATWQQNVTPLLGGDCVMCSEHSSFVSNTSTGNDNMSDTGHCRLTVYRLQIAVCLTPERRFLLAVGERRTSFWRVQPGPMGQPCGGYRVECVACKNCDRGRDVTRLKFLQNLSAF